MARIDGDPAVWHPLPGPLAANLGLALAGFGHLEDMLKRAVFALERDRLASAITAHDFRDWLTRMDAVAADSLGTLIERLDRDMRRAERGDPDLIATLDEVKSWRNLLCHAAWQPRDGQWHPRFSNTRGEIFDGALDSADLRAILALTLDTAQRVLRLIRDIPGANDLTAAD